jgi:peptidoglycan/LPS O-acetylase OafA/YrhL
MTEEGELAVERSVLPRLTSLRWYAALMVFLFHVVTHGWRPLRPFNFGTVGVTFFFVLSGFVLVWSTSADVAARTFYRRRFARIYPSYLVMLVLAVALASWSSIDLGRSRSDAVQSIFMLQAWFGSATHPFVYDVPEWTLSCEAFFYLLFPLLFVVLRRLSGRRRDLLVAGSVVVAVVVAALLTNAGHFTQALDLPVIRLPEFMVGMWCALKVREGWRPRVPLWAAIVVVVVAYEVARVLGNNAYLAHGDYVMLLPIALLLIAAACTDLRGTSGLLTRPTSIYLGEVSFAFYLVHWVVLAAVLHLHGWGRHPWGLTSGVEPIVIMFVVSLLAAVTLHHLVELPLQRRLRGAGTSIATADPQLVARADVDRRLDLHAE